MIVDPLGVIDYEEGGTGPTLVFVPGSCSTGAAWRPIIRALGGNYRCVTTSLPGYGGTAERRNDSDMSMERVAEAVETVVAKTTEPVHLVGHSFGGLVAAAVAMRGRAPLASLTVLEAPAFMLLQSRPAETHHYRAFVDMTEGYFTAFTRGDEDAVARMIDFYGGKGTFAGWPDRIRAYVQETTAVNIWDWRTAFEFPLPSTKLAMIELPSLVVWGGNSHPAAKRANELLAKSLPKARAAELDGAAHFMIATHPSEIAALLADHIAEATAT